MRCFLGSRQRPARGGRAGRIGPGRRRRDGHIAERTRFGRAEGCPQALGESDPPHLRGRSPRLPSLRRKDEDHRLHHRAASHSGHCRLAAAKRPPIGGRLAPPPTPRSPGRRWRALRGELEEGGQYGAGWCSGRRVAEFADQLSTTTEDPPFLEFCGATGFSNSFWSGAKR